MWNGVRAPYEEERRKRNDVTRENWQGLNRQGVANNQETLDAIVPKMPKAELKPNRKFAWRWRKQWFWSDRHINTHSQHYDINHPIMTKHLQEEQDRRDTQGIALGLELHYDQTSTNGYRSHRRKLFNDGLLVGHKKQGKMPWLHLTKTFGGIPV